MPIPVTGRASVRDPLARAQAPPRSRGRRARRAPAVIDAEPAGDDDLAAGSAGGQFAAHDRDRRPRAAACRCRPSPSSPGSSRELAMPIPPHAVQSMAMPRVAGRVVRKLETQLAQEVVRGAVVGLSRVAEPAGDRAERHRRTERHVAERESRSNQPSPSRRRRGRTPAGSLSRKEPADLESGRRATGRRCVRSSRATCVDDAGDRRGVAQVDAVVVRASLPRRSTASIAVSAACARSRPAISLLDHRRRDALAARLARSKRSRLRPSRSVGEPRGCPASFGSGAGVRSSRWNVPPRRGRRDPR